MKTSAPAPLRAGHPASRAELVRADGASRGADRMEILRRNIANDPVRSPWETLAWLRCAWDSGVLPSSRHDEAYSLARRCGRFARQQFAELGRDEDAVTSGDAMLTCWLITEKLPMGVACDAAHYLAVVYAEVLTHCRNPRWAASAVSSMLKSLYASLAESTPSALLDERRAARAAVINRLIREELIVSMERTLLPGGKTSSLVGN
jgi:hypothetical protein